MRTNIDIDDTLMDQVLAETGVKTKAGGGRARFANVLAVGTSEGRVERFAWIGHLQGDLSAMRRDR